MGKAAQPIFLGRARAIETKIKGKQDFRAFRANMDVLYTVQSLVYTVLYTVQPEQFGENTC
jgi:hypothetical protein